MSIFDNAPDNLEGTPSLEGQGQPNEAVGTEVNPTPPAAQTGAEGQGAEGQQQGAPQQETDYRELYENTKKAYDNLRPAYTRATQELSKLKQTTPAEQPIRQAPTRGYTNPEEEVTSLITGIVQQAVAPLQEQQAELVMQSEVAKFKATTPDFDEQAPAMYNILEQMPELWNVGDVGTVLGTAYKRAKGEAMEKQLPDLVSQAQNGAYASQVVKEINATDKMRPNTQAQTQKSQADIIKEGILEEAKKTQGSIF